MVNQRTTDRYFRALSKIVIRLRFRIVQQQDYRDDCRELEQSAETRAHIAAAETIIQELKAVERDLVQFIERNHPIMNVNPVDKLNAALINFAVELFPAKGANIAVNYQKMADDLTEHVMELLGDPANFEARGWNL